jgi:group I intron endonuclease
MDNYVIYKHTSPSGKSYIGQTKQYDKRCKEHQTSTGCRALSAAIKKYGWDTFSHEILIEGLSVDDANHWEAVFILEHNTVAPNGYNLRTGGANSSPSDETRAKISAARLGATSSDETRAKVSAIRQGTTRSDETRAKLSAAQKGKNYSDETKAKMSAAKLGTTHTDETKAKLSVARRARVQPLHSDETKAKISAAKLGKKRGPYKKKLQLEPDISSS